RMTKLNRGMLASITDALASVKPLKAMGRQERAGAVVGDQARSMKKALRREVTTREALKAAQEVSQVAILVGVAWAGRSLWGMSPAEILVMILLLARMLNGLGKLQNAWQEVAVCESAYWSLRSTIDEARRQVEPLAGRIPPRFEREIRFDRVSFA